MTEAGPISPFWFSHLLNVLGAMSIFAARIF